MKVLEIILFVNVLATFCDADNYDAKTFESVFLKNPSKHILKDTTRVSGDFEDTINDSNIF